MTSSEVSESRGEKPENAIVRNRFQLVELIRDNEPLEKWLAIDLSCLRSVILWRLRPEFESNVAIRKQFVSNARLYSRLCHPNVVAVFDCFEDDQGPVVITESTIGLTQYLTQEPGGNKQQFRALSLRDRIETSGAMPVSEALAVVQAICSALEAMHKNHLVHRDIRPEHIFFVPGSEPKLEPRLIDFGLAGDQTDGLRHVGTMGYGAPKQDDTSQQADVYSLAAVLYYLSTGRSPREYGDASAPPRIRQLLNAVLSESPAPRPSLSSVQRMLQDAISAGDEVASAKVRSISDLPRDFSNTQRTVDPDHPWLGLTPYTEDTKEYFFGRDEEVRDLYLRVREQPLTILYGQSGLGKTSLLGAGLIPKLRVEGYRPILLRLGFESGDLPITEQVFYTLSYLQNRQSGSIANFRRQRTLWELFHELAGGIATNLRTPPVLIFDQFEEIFTLGNTKDRQAEAAELFRQLADLIENRPPQAVQDRMRSERRSAREYDFGTSPVRVIITLREDFLSHLEAYKKLMPSLMRNRMAVSMLNGPQALEAVVRPGRLEGRNLVSDEVGARIVRFVANRSPETPLEEIGAVPPLLSLLCDELNQLRIEQQQPMIASGENAFAGLESVGRDILNGFYTRSFAGLHPAVRDYIEDRMVTIGGHRNPIAFEDAIADLRAADVSDSGIALNQLIQGRLLSIEDRNGVQRLEITHDVLTPLVVRSRDERRERQRAEKAEQEREAADQRERTIRRDRRKLQLVATAMIVLAVVAIVGMGWAFLATREARQQTNKARDQEALAKTAEQKASNAADRLRERQTELEAEQSKSKTLLKEAAQSDRIRARELWEQMQYRDALAYWSRSLEYDPTSLSCVQETVALLSQTPLPYPDKILEGHADTVYASMFSPNGMLIATRSSNGKAHLWEAKSGRLLYTLEGHEGEVSDAVFSPDSCSLATSASDKTVKIWNVINGTILHTLTGHSGGVNKSRFSHNGTVLATCSEDKTCRAWEVATGTLLATMEGHTDDVVDIEFSPNDEIVLSASHDKTAKLWNALTGKHIATLEGHSDKLRRATFSPSGSQFATCGEGGAIRLWDTVTANEVGTLLGHDTFVVNIEFSPDGTRLASASFDGTIRLWDVENRQCESVLYGHRRAAVTANFSPDGCRIVSASLDGTSIIWETDSSRLVAVLDGNEDRKNAVFDARFSMDGTSVLTSSDSEKAILWDESTWQIWGDRFDIISPSTTLHAIAYSPSGDLLYTNSLGESFIYGPKGNFTEPSGGTGFVPVYSSTGNLRASARGNICWLVDTATGGDDVLGVLDGHSGRITSINFIDEDQSVITSSEDGTVRVWGTDDWGDWELRRSYQHTGASIIDAAADASGERVAAAVEDVAVVWSKDEDKFPKVLAGHAAAVTSVSFDSEGQRLLTSSEDGTARIWNPATGATLLTLTGHSNAIFKARFSYDDCYILTAANDGSARIWDSVSGECLSVFRTDGDHVFDARFAPDGLHIATCSSSCIQIWPIIRNFKFESSPWIGECLRSVGRREIGSNGLPHNVVLEEAERDRLQGLLFQLATVPKADGTDAPVGTAHNFLPQEKLTRVAKADADINKASSEIAIRRAYRWRSGHPLIQIALAKFEQNETRAIFLREYGVSRLLKRQPSDKESATDIAALCRRAEAFLTDQGDQPRTALVRKRAEELEAGGK